MFDFKNANDEQKKAITHTDGALLITAGPGTGKTFTLVQRAVYLIQEKHVSPEQIMIATFTEKAAKEIVTRISNELMERNIPVDISEMYIGTFHSICLRFIKDNLEYTDFKKNYRMLDSFDQQYLIFQNYFRTFRPIENIDVLFSNGGVWSRSQNIANLVNTLNEELVESALLCSDDDLEIRAAGEILRAYNELLIENNTLDFSTIQTAAYRLLTGNREILEKLREQIQYIMIDEYQDTNYIQEQIVFLLGGERRNIAVVGDDDQGLYRFRGATIRNILEFPSKFEDGFCKRVSLVTNYRSDSKIVDFYNKWMATTGGANFKFDWGKFRYNKSIVPNSASKLKSPTVVTVVGDDDEDEWHKNVLTFVQKLLSSGKVTNLNQIAFLFNSVRGERVVKLADFLEKNGVNIYSPRSNMFFQRDEIKLSFGFLLLAFPVYLGKLNERDFNYADENLCVYYESCVKRAAEYLKENSDSLNLKRWVAEKGRAHSQLTRNTVYAFSGLFYQLMEFEPFAGILDTELTNGAVDLRPVRNLAMFSQILAKFEYLHRVNIFTTKTIDNVVEKFFNMYIRFLYNGGIGEYEDDSEYAPSGCVSFLTIHQSKGMEFPVTVVGSLNGVPRNRANPIIEKIEPKYFHRKAFEPTDRVKLFDFWRLYYTAFSRAQNLLVLTCNEHGGTRAEPSKYFREVYKGIPSFFGNDFDLSEFTFSDVKSVNIKERYSFTSHISEYETCGVQYKFFKELGFAPIIVGATAFGTLVHQTIEDIHKSALRHEEHLITAENIEKWFNSNYNSITKREHTYLAEPQLKAALGHVMRYVERQGGDWSRIQETEVEVGLVKPNYILEGKIDLITGDNNTVEIVDFKSEKKPNLATDKDRVEHYKKQLQVYAYLVEERTGKTVSKMHLYYTGAENEVPTITFPKNDASIEQTISEFDKIVEKIQAKDFGGKSKSQQTCDNCDFKYYCTNIRKG
ncbi:MAG: ATP-dependent helicase [Bacteroides sp.]|nr:ATP-dependent helicase [Eubacterium sp.]MCM1417524.1 ATP-dependent helicase [Roseburia sp.]MCM1462559.1 ATP-dependent helicase [Bacteroides sp.]